MNTTDKRYFLDANDNTIYTSETPGESAWAARRDYTEVILVPLPTVTLGEPDATGYHRILVDGEYVVYVYSDDTDATLAERRDRHLRIAGAIEAARRILAAEQPTQAARDTLAYIQALPEADQAWIRGAL